MTSPFRALIGVDGSEDGEDAFRFYVEKMHTPEREALLVYVVKPLTISSNEMAIYVADIRERSLIEEKTKVKFIKDTYEEQMRTLGIRGKINIIYYSNKPGKMICELAEHEHCTAIVVGCRRCGTSNLGPTVDYVLRKASCSVVLASGKQRRESFDSVASLGQFQAMKSPRDSVADLGQQFQAMKTSKNSEERFRRISCPAKCSPPIIPEEVGFGKEAAGGARESKSDSMLEKTEGGAKDVLQLPKQRRHSVVVNAFHQLQASGRKMLIRKRSETIDDSEETN